MPSSTWLDDQPLLDDGLELVVSQINAVYFSPAVQLDDPIPDRAGVLEIELRENADVLLDDRGFPPAKVVASLAADGHQADIRAGALPHELLNLTRNIGVERAAQPPIGRDDDEQDPILGPDFLALRPM